MIQVSPENVQAAARPPMLWSGWTYCRDRAEQPLAVRAEAWALRTLERLRLLRAWWTLATAALGLLARLRLLPRGAARAVVVPSLSGGLTAPLRDGRVLTLGQVFGGQAHAGAACEASKSSAILVVRVRRDPTSGALLRVGRRYVRPSTWPGARREPGRS